ncbi:DNA repair protein RecN [Aureibaculum sp. 2210JD6-5]|uniref:DNA repair protein RecN n=1 Tax=Aureibaculum sp. 2210JD6-5 TaxID=3103957 RepID=UPI002AAC9593|nr:DNA repair protein RecN [Aureibaculum sp. 2210JD6-5]MDY7395489.1 DNA repair protein RecN [Aureibaculum sp. 2210JD6-5]
MLASLSIKNYALIDSLEVNFKDGFSIITGETGAGKSILLGALELILGKRADLSSLKKKEDKCIIEGEFLIEKYDLQSFFETNDLDFEKSTIIRREILPSGKSRAFINDTPTTLSLLSDLSDKLIDVHSQHQTLQLADNAFQFLIVDALADNHRTLVSYKKGLKIYKKLNKELDEIISRQAEAQSQHDYNSFLLNELLEADFKENEQEFLEETLEKLNHVEEIKLLLTEAQQLADIEEVGISDSLRKYVSIIQKLSKYGKTYENLSDRITSLKIDFDDITNELDDSNDAVDYSPQEIEKYNDRLQLLYNLQKKHQVNSISELLDKQQILTVKVSAVENADSIINAKKSEILEVEKQLNTTSEILYYSRKKAIPELIKQLETLLKDLEMPNTSFKINLQKKETFFNNGKDELEFLISTNKGSSYETLKKIASGGEMSRIMLAVKAILCNYSSLPTIIFDEIDTGVSGEVSNRIANVMAKMSEKMQVIAITHLPQIAAKGKHHFKVYKTNKDKQTFTNIKQLSNQERIQELAEMLSGKDIAETAVVHAKQLLDQ